MAVLIRSGPRAPHHRDGFLLIEMRAGIHQHDAIFGLHGDEVGEPSIEHHARCDFLVLAGRSQRMLLLDGDFAVPEFL